MAPVLTASPTPTSLNPSQHPSTLKLRRQIFEELDIEHSYPAQVSRPTLLDEAIKPTSEPCKPRLLTVDEACAHQEAKHSMHHGQASPACVVEDKGVTFYIPNDAAVLEPKAVCSNALEPSAAPEAASTAAALGPEPPCVAASPAVMTPKSYTAVAKASVVTAAPPQPAAVPKPSAAPSQLAADTAAEAEAPSPINKFVAKVVDNVIETVSKSKSEQATVYLIYPFIHPPTYPVYLSIFLYLSLSFYHLSIYLSVCQNTSDSRPLGGGLYRALLRSRHPRERCSLHDSALAAPACGMGNRATSCPFTFGSIRQVLRGCSLGAWGEDVPLLSSMARRPLLPWAA